MFAFRGNYISYNGGVTPPPGGDPYWTNVSVLINNENPTGAFNDSSTNKFLVTVSGTARPNERTPFASGAGGSIRIDGTTASQVIIPQNVDFNAASNNFTLEGWVFIPSFPGNSLEFFAIATSAASIGQATARIVSTNAGAVFFLCNNASNGWINTSTTTAGTLTTNTWYHLAGVRNGSSFVLYVNGVSRLSYTYAGVVGYLGTNSTHIGNLPVGTGFTGANNCFISNVRWVNGTAIYTSAFTPPTSPLTAVTNTKLLLTFTGQASQSTTTTIGAANYSIVDTGPNGYPLLMTTSPGHSGISPFGNEYPGSVAYTGSQGMWIGATASANFAYGTQNFTIECWVQFTSVGTLQYIIDQRSASTSICPSIYLNTDNKIYYYVNGSNVITSTNTVTTDTWYHIAVSRSSSNTKMFINGVQEGSTYSDSNNYANANARFGVEFTANSNYLNGYLSNIRLSRGFSYYTSDFTPSTIPLTISTLYTLAFISGQNAATYNLSNYPKPYVGASSILSNTQSAFGTQSLFYNGATTTAIIDDISVRFGTGDFTIEGWVYRSSAGVQHGLLSKGTATPSWELRVNTSNQLQFFSNTSLLLTGATTTIPATTWTYFAVTRSGTTSYLFVNGTLQASATDSTDYSQTNNIFMGNTTAGGYLTGYLDEVRITKGIARYTASFTAPTSAFPTD